MQDILEYIYSHVLGIVKTWFDGLVVMVVFWGYVIYVKHSWRLCIGKVMCHIAHTFFLFHHASVGIVVFSDTTTCLVFNYKLGVLSHKSLSFSAIRWHCKTLQMVNITLVYCCLVVTKCLCQWFVHAFQHTTYLCFICFWPLCCEITSIIWLSFPTKGTVKK